MLDIICARTRSGRLNVGMAARVEPLQRRHRLTSRNRQREHSSRREFGGAPEHGLKGPALKARPGPGCPRSGEPGSPSRAGALFPLRRAVL